MRQEKKENAMKDKTIKETKRNKKFKRMTKLKIEKTSVKINLKS